MDIHLYLQVYPRLGKSCQLLSLLRFLRCLGQLTRTIEQLTRATEAA